MNKFHRHHFHFRDHFVSWAALFTALIVILIINAAYISSRIENENENHNSPSQNVANSNTILTSLQADETQAYTVNVKNVTENATIDYAFTLDPDHTMLTLDISITNHSQAKQDLIPVNQLYVRDREGDTFMMHPSMFLKDPLAATSVGAGQTVKGQISFDVPKRLANPLLYVDFGWNNQAPTVIDVLK